MTVVQIEKPEDTKLADWFAELRLWCNPILFTEVGKVKSGSSFNIKFANVCPRSLVRFHFFEVRADNSAPDRRKPSEVKEDLDLTDVSV
jgi:hypothetical protein